MHNHNQNLVSILDLQNLDLVIIRIKSEMEQIPAEVIKIEDAMEVDKRQQKIFEEAFKKQCLEQKGLEGEIQAKKEQIKKYESQLNAVKTNDEYSKLLKEIVTVKEQILRIEEKTLILMEKAESGNREIASRKAQMEEGIKKWQGVIAEKKKNLQEANAQLEILTTQRTAQATKCQGTIYQLYEKFMQKKHAIALVPVEKNGTCGGCRRSLPPNIKNEVMKGKIIQCDSCSRLLFWSDFKMESDASSDPVKVF